MYIILKGLDYLNCCTAIFTAFFMGYRQIYQSPTEATMKIATFFPLCNQGLAAKYTLLFIVKATHETDYRGKAFQD